MARDEGCKARKRATIRPCSGVSQHTRRVLQPSRCAAACGLEPQTAFGRNRKVMALFFALVLLAGAGLAGFWLTSRQWTAGVQVSRNWPHKLTDFTLVTDTLSLRADQEGFNPLGSHHRNAMKAMNRPVSRNWSISALRVVERHPGAKRSSLFGGAKCMRTSTPLRLTSIPSASIGLDENSHRPGCSRATKPALSRHGPGRP